MVDSLAWDVLLDRTKVVVALVVRGKNVVINACEVSFRSLHANAVETFELGGVESSLAWREHLLIKVLPVRLRLEENLALIRAVDSDRFLFYAEHSRPLGYFSQVLYQLIQSSPFRTL